MKNNSYFDCFLLMGAALSMKSGAKSPELGQLLIEDVFTTQVTLSLVIEDVIIVDKENMVIEIDGLMNQEWLDPRLGANILTRKMAVAGQIWEPKIINLNGENRIGNQEDIVFWRGYGKEGKVVLSKKIKVNVRCTKDFKKFPFDTQYCTLKLGSYRFPKDEVTILWNDEPIVIHDTLKMGEFSLKNVSQDIAMDIRLSGNFSTATVQFAMKRNFFHYLFCTGVPCILMVFLDFVSLWMELDRRWNLNLLSLSGNLYLYYISICLVHPVSYMKALDVLTGLCTVFSLISLLETFLVDAVSKLEQKYFHSGDNARFKSLNRMLDVIELGMKIAFPIFYVFLVSLYVYVYIS